jgi:hypothetical protein
MRSSARHCNCSGALYTITDLDEGVERELEKLEAEKQRCRSNQRSEK